MILSTEIFSKRRKIYTLWREIRVIYPYSDKVADHFQGDMYFITGALLVSQQKHIVMLWIQTVLIYVQHKMRVFLMLWY